MRSVRELQELAVVGRARRVEALHFGGDADREAARVEEADRRGSAAAGEQGRPRRLHVQARGGHEPETGDRDPAPRPGHAPLPGAISTRAVETVLPSILAARLAVTALARSGCSSIRSSTVWPGRMNERIFTSVTRAG